MNIHKFSFFIDPIKSLTIHYYLTDKIWYYYHNFQLLQIFHSYLSTSPSIFIISDTVMFSSVVYSFEVVVVWIFASLMASFTYYWLHDVDDKFDICSICSLVMKRRRGVIISLSQSYYEVLLHSLKIFLLNPGLGPSWVLL